MNADNTGTLPETATNSPGGTHGQAEALANDLQTMEDEALLDYEEDKK